MDDSRWLFEEPQNVAVLTTTNVVKHNTFVLYVSHDSDDGMWQFHDGADVDENNAMLISLQEMVELDPSISELADLPLGWIAWRRSTNESWNREKDPS